ncbi:UDP-N-acetylmuramoyl-tripeptide--D-alanyl-D-alanine ligase [Bacteroidia bacterium]|nr:UDP-N-acetylmuramoyl-tripeptide--D-alanyl-D-alanine ligase [Bacteroidia bacterium]
MNIPALYQLFLRYPCVETDSRKPLAGSLFFALKGLSFDGNRFASQALSKGAEYAIIDNPDYFAGERTIVVEDVLKTLQSLASHHRKVLGIPVIGITGTNGKTTTKELLAAVLSAKYKVLYTEGNLNNQIGVPLTLLRLAREHEIAVVEMGASRLGDIKELVEIALPNYGIITNVGHAHLEGFGSFENLVKAKGELYDFIRQSGGLVFINKEDKELQALAGGLKQVAYGMAGDSFVSGHTVANNPFLTFNWEQEGETHTVETHLIGNYNIGNAMAAVAAGRYFGIPAGLINRSIAAYEPSNNRSQLSKTALNTLIVDAYNANPDSMKAAIRNFKEINGSPKAIILGDMKELGETSLSLHEEIVKEAEAGKFDKVFLCGALFTQAGKGFATFPTTESLIAHLKQYPIEGHCILLKASRSMAFEKIIEWL